MTRTSRFRKDASRDACLEYFQHDIGFGWFAWFDFHFQRWAGWIAHVRYILTHSGRIFFAREYAHKKRLLSFRTDSHSTGRPFRLFAIAYPSAVLLAAVATLIHASYRSGSFQKPRHELPQPALDALPNKLPEPKPPRWSFCFSVRFIGGLAQ